MKYNETTIFENSSKNNMTNDTFIVQVHKSNVKELHRSILYIDNNRTEKLKKKKK